MKTTKIYLAVLAGMLSLASFGQFNYGEALQKSLLFYETQQSGVLPDWNRINWRSNSGVNDGADVGLDLTGGWNDAGDHVKFGFPMAFSVTALNWGYLEYKDGYDAVNQTEIYKRNIKWVTDYFIKCHPSPNVFYAQVADSKSQDHNFWMPAEMVDVHPQYGERKSYAITANNPGTEVACETAAALASASIIFKDSDPAYSATLLQHARELYEFGDTYRGLYTDENAGNIPADGTYTSGNFQDELTWGALWLYQATGEQQYLDKAIAEYAEPDYLWSLVWEDKSYGNMVLLAILTGEERYKQNAERHLDWWQEENNGVAYSPGGQAHLTIWGSSRHAMNASLTALIYSDNVDTPKKQQYHDFAKNQLDYVLGDNPMERSLVTGFGVNPPTMPHHRGQHSSWTRSEENPIESRHTLWGALMGGPLRPDDTFVEDRGDFQANEVATDYNACYSGVLARMIMEYGGSELPNFPQPEPAGVEFLNEVKLNNDSSRFTEVAIWLNNRSGWPARVPGSMKARYFVDISEGIAAGYEVNDYTLTARGAGSTTVSSLQEWDADNNIYYAEIEVDSNEMPFPGGLGEYRSEIQLRVALPNDAPESAWDASNDFSYQGLDNQLKVADNVPIYIDGVLAGGNEPNGGETPTALFTTNVVTGVSPLEVAFDASNSFDPNGDDLSYNWDFGNGQTSTLVSPTIIFTEIASYLVSLTVTDGINTSASFTTTITVTDSSPVAAFEVSSPFAVQGTEVQFDATSSQDPTGGVLTYSWDFGNGQTATSATATTVYEDLGEVAVTLTVTNEAGETDIATKTINVTDGTVNCAFGTPAVDALPSVDTVYENIFVLGEAGPNLDNVTKLTLNWNLPNNGLYQFAINTNNGTPGWYVNFEDSLTYNFNTPQPELTLSGTSISGLDGAYWVNIEQGNFVMVAKSGAFTIYFTNSAVAPDCGVVTSPLPDGGNITGGPFEFTVGDGISDNVSGVTLAGNTGANSQWVVTDADNNILGLPEAIGLVNFDTVGNGTCLIWHLSYEDGLQGLATGNNIADLAGNYDFSNAITVLRNPVVNVEVDGGVITGGPFEFTNGQGVEPDISAVTLSGNQGANSLWVITNDANNIVEITPVLELFSASSGTYALRHLSYEDGLQGLAVGNNTADLVGDFDFSNAITIVWRQGDISNDCTFNTPSMSSLPSVNNRYDKVFVIGSGGPSLASIRQFSINWDATNNGLYVFAVNTNTGVPGWYVDFKGNMTYSLNTPEPQVTLSNTQINGLDGAYWVNLDGDNFVMVSQTGGYTLYFTNGEAPACFQSSAKLLVDNETASAVIEVYPNPASEFVNVKTSFTTSQMVLLTMEGKVVVVKNTTAGSSIFDVSGLNVGIYMLQVYNGDQLIKVEKVVVR